MFYSLHGLMLVGSQKWNALYIPIHTSGKGVNLISDNPMFLFIYIYVTDFVHVVKQETKRTS